MSDLTEGSRTLAPPVGLHVNKDRTLAGSGYPLIPIIPNDCNHTDVIVPVVLVYATQKSDFDSITHVWLRLVRLNKHAVSIHDESKFILAGRFGFPAHNTPELETLWKNLQFWEISPLSPTGIGLAPVLQYNLDPTGSFSTYQHKRTSELLVFLDFGKPLIIRPAGYCTL